MTAGSVPNKSHVECPHIDEEHSILKYRLTRLTSFRSISEDFPERTLLTTAR